MVIERTRVVSRSILDDLNTLRTAHAATGTSPEIWNYGKVAEDVRDRRKVWAWLRDEAGMGYDEIARITVGPGRHSTVIEALRRPARASGRHA